jgi:serine/threonine protein kinase/WD40 repeat protein
MKEALSQGPHASSFAANRDSNLLIAFMAHLLGFFDAKKFASAVTFWTANPSIQMSTLLVEQELVTELERDYISGLIEQSLEFHGNDAGEVIKALGGQNRLKALLAHASDSSHYSMLTTKLKLRSLTDESDSIEIDEIALEEKIGRYTRSREHSRGGMGRILLVHDELLLRDIALKELLPSNEGSDDDVSIEGSPMRRSGAMMARFLREARITGGLEHPTIVPVYEIGRRENGTLYYTMRLVKGKTLRTALEECIGLQDRLRLLSNYLDLCMGMAYAHSKGIVHRDIKPSNVMIGEFGETVIVDWGLAKLVGAADDEGNDPSPLSRVHGPDAISPDKTVPGEFMGSPHYMSPEQTSGETDRIDSRSDVYSLGVVLYEILTNTVPFDGTSIEEIVERIERHEYKPVDDVEPLVPKELASICSRALSKSPADRYSSAKGIGDDIQNFLSGSLVSVYNYSIREKVGLYYTKHRAMVNLAVASVLLIIAITLISFRSTTQSRDIAILASQNERTARTEAETANYFAEIRLAASYIENKNFRAAEETLWNTDASYRDWEWGFFLNLSRPEMLWFEGFSGAEIGPDGTTLAVASRSKPLTLFDMISGDKISELPIAPATVLSMEFSPDGDRLLIASRENSVQIWDLRAKVRTHIFSTPLDSNHTAHFFSDGSRVYGIAQSGTIRVWNVLSGEVENAVDCGDGLTDAFLSPDEEILIAWKGDRPEPEVQAWQLNSNEKLWSRPGNRAVPGSDSSLLLVHNQDVLSVSHETGETLNSYSGHEAKTSRVVAEEGGRYAVSGDIAGNVCFWDLDQPVPVAKTKVHSSEIHRIQVSESSSNVLVSDRLGNVAMFELPSGKLLNSFDGHTLPLTQLRFASEGEKVVTASLRDIVRVWSSHATPGVKTKKPVEYWANTVQMTDEDRTSSIFGLFGIATLFDGELENASKEFRVDNIRSYVSSSRISNDGRIALFGLDGFTAIAYDVIQEEIITTIGSHVGVLSAVEFLDESNVIVTGGWDGHIKLWDMDGALLATQTSDSSVTALKAIPDTSEFMVGFDSGKLWRVDVNSPNSPREFGTHAGKIYEIKYLQDRNWILTASADRTAVLWDLDLDAKVHDFEGHGSAVLTAAANRSGSIIATSTQNAVYLWETQKGNRLFSISTTDRDVDSRTRHLLFQENSLIELTFDGFTRNYERVAIDSSLNLEEQKAQFEENSLNSASEEPPTVSRKDLTTVFFTTNEIATDGLRKLGQLFRTEESQNVEVSPPGQVLPAATPKDIRYSLGLNNAQSIVRIDGEVMISNDMIADGLEALGGDISSGRKTGFELQFMNERELSTQRYVLIPANSTSVSISGTRESIVARLEKFSEALEVFEDTIVNRQKIFDASANAILEPNAEINGLAISGSASMLNLDDYLSIGIGNGDRIISMDDQPIRVVGEFNDQLQGAIDEISKLVRDEIVFSIQRGIFSSVNLTLRVE